MRPSAARIWFQQPGPGQASCQVVIGSEPPLHGQSGVPFGDESCRRHRTTELPHTDVSAWLGGVVRDVPRRADRVDDADTGQGPSHPL
jgi:hypothetical protein